MPYGFFMPILLTHVGPVSAACVVGILDNTHRAVDIACPKIDGIHRVKNDVVGDILMQGEVKMRFSFFFGAIESFQSQPGT